MTIDLNEVFADAADLLADAVTDSMGVDVIVYFPTLFKVDGVLGI